MFRTPTLKQQHARNVMSILWGRRSDLDGATVVHDAIGVSEAAAAPAPNADFPDIDDLPPPTVDDDLFAPPPSPIGLIDIEDVHRRDLFGYNEQRFHYDAGGVARRAHQHEAVVASDSDVGLVEEQIEVSVMTSLSFCTCCAEHLV